MPLPPELTRDPVVVKISSSRVIVLNKLRPFRIDPYRLMDLVTPWPGGQERRFSVGGSLGFAWEKAQLRGTFSFRLEKEGSEAALHGVVCEWRVEKTSGAFPGPGASSVSFRIPFPSFLVCEFTEAPDAEPWRLELWTGFPSNPFAPKFESRGALFCADVRYEADSTNVIESVGLRAQYMTGTLFTRDGQAVAAVERILPGRILIQPSVSPAEQSLFVAVGAAIFVYDSFASPLYGLYGR